MVGQYDEEEKKLVKDFWRDYGRFIVVAVLLGLSLIHI